MAAGAKRLKLAAQREHDASGRLEELFQRGGHELLHRGAELLTRARGISDDRSPMSRGASYGAAGGAVDGGGGGGVSGDRCDAEEVEWLRREDCQVALLLASLGEEGQSQAHDA